jgi:hypothetical protein
MGDSSLIDEVEILRYGAALPLANVICVLAAKPWLDRICILVFTYLCQCFNARFPDNRLRASACRYPKYSPADIP